MSKNELPSRIKKTINIGVGRLACGILIELILAALIVGVIVVIALYYNEFKSEEKFIAWVALPIVALWLVYMGFVFGSRVVLTDKDLTYFGIEEWFARLLKRNGAMTLKYAQSVKYSDMQSIYTYSEETVPFCPSKKYIVLNMKNRSPYKMPVSMFSDKKIKRIMEEIIALSGNSAEGLHIQAQEERVIDNR